MSYIRRNMNFGDFVEHIGVTFIITIIAIGFLGFLIPAAIYSDEVMAKRTVEHNIYSALKGEEIDDEAAVKTANLITSLYKRQIYALQDLKETETSYFEVAIANIDNVELILEKAPEAAAIDVKIPAWRDWFLMLGWINWLVLGVSLSIAYIATSDRHDKWWQYPWNKAWAYPAIMVMLPYVVTVQPIVLICAIVRKLNGADRRENEARRRAEEMRQREETESKLIIKPQRLIEQKRVELQDYMASLKNATEHHREGWIKICSQKLIMEKQMIELQIQDERSQLSNLGQQIEVAQRNLAKAQARLNILEETINNRRPQEKEEFGKEFDQIFNFPQVKAIEVLNDEIRVYTSTIYASFEGKKYELGDYGIRIRAKDAGYLEIKNFCNTSNCSSGHPHTYSYNWTNFCFGNVSEYVYKLLKERDYPTLIAVTLSALQKISENPPVSPKNWKEAKGNG